MPTERPRYNFPIFCAFFTLSCILPPRDLKLKLGWYILSDKNNHFAIENTIESNRFSFNPRIQKR